MILVTPGIRPEGAAAADQKRATTPAAAIAAGADYLVVGRPITRGERPARGRRGDRCGNCRRPCPKIALILKRKTPGVPPARRAILSAIERCRDQEHTIEDLP